MSSAKIYAPNPAFAGDVAGVTFVDGVGTYDPHKNPAAARYFDRHGYAASRKGAEPDEDDGAEAAPLTSLEVEAAPAGHDARDFGEPIAIGTTLRDAAVDPHPEDFLPPINAGHADPHGPDMVAPEIHHAGPKGIKPGDVHVGEPAKQDKAESDHAELVLMKGEEHPSADEDADRGPLGLSDPGSVEMGVKAAKDVSAAEAAAASMAPRKAPAKKRSARKAPAKKGS